jgi:hypothetical protein
MLTASIIALMMETVSNPETLIGFYQTTQHKMPADSYLEKWLI